MRVIMVGVLLLFSSCSCDKQMQRLERKCPDLFANVTVRDTLLVPAIQIDTAFVLTPSVSDTFYIQKDRAVVKLLRVHDTIYTNIFVAGDTVVKTQTVTVPTKIIEKTPSVVNHLLRLLIFVGTMGLVIYLLKRNV